MYTNQKKKFIQSIAEAQKVLKDITKQNTSWYNDMGEERSPWSPIQDLV